MYIKEPKRALRALKEPCHAKEPCTYNKEPYKDTYTKAPDYFIQIYTHHRDTDTYTKDTYLLLYSSTKMYVRTERFFVI